MPSSRVALPPGLYYISATNYADKWITTKGSLKNLELDGASNKQLWKVTGSGQLLYPSTNYFAISDTPARDVYIQGATTPPTNTWSTWSINVVDNKDGSFKGYIMSSNNAIDYWAVDGDGKSIIMKGDKIEWVFTPA